MIKGSKTIASEVFMTLLAFKLKVLADMRCVLKHIIPLINFQHFVGDCTTQRMSAVGVTVAEYTHI